MAEPEDYWESPDGPEPHEEERRSGKLLFFSVAVSLFLHITAGAVFFSLQIGRSPEPTPDTVRIQLIPSNPLQEQSEEVAFVEPSQPEPPEETIPDPPSEEIDSSELAEVLEEPEALSPVETETIQTDIAELSEAIIPEQEILTPVQTEPSLPSITEVRRSVLSVDAERSNKIYLYDCNQIEESAGIRDCKPRDNRNYQSLTRNPIYESFNPPWEITRSRQTVGFMAQHSEDLLEQLRASGISEGLSDYLMAEVEASLELYTNTGNRTVEQMIRMTDRSAAAQMIEAILNDPFVRIQSRLLRERSYSEWMKEDVTEECSFALVLKIATLRSFGCTF